MLVGYGDQYEHFETSPNVSRDKKRVRTGGVTSDTSAKHRKLGSQGDDTVQSLSPLQVDGKGVGYVEIYEREGNGTWHLKGMCEMARKC